MSGNFAIKGGGGRTPNGKCHLKFPFWLLAHLPKIGCLQCADTPYTQYPIPHSPLRSDFCPKFAIKLVHHGVGWFHRLAKPLEVHSVVAKKRSSRKAVLPIALSGFINLKKRILWISPALVELINFWKGDMSPGQLYCVPWILWNQNIASVHCSDDRIVCWAVKASKKRQFCLISFILQNVK